MKTDWCCLRWALYIRSRACLRRSASSDGRGNARRTPTKATRRAPQPAARNQRAEGLYGDITRRTTLSVVRAIRSCHSPRGRHSPWHERCRDSFLPVAPYVASSRRAGGRSRSDPAVVSAGTQAVYGVASDNSKSTSEISAYALPSRSRLGRRKCRRTERRAVAASQQRLHAAY